MLYFCVAIIVNAILFVLCCKHNIYYLFLNGKT
nr:MAG TPA: TMEM119 family protein [Caudoviricetes sp.]